MVLEEAMTKSWLEEPLLTPELLTNLLPKLVLKPLMSQMDKFLISMMLLRNIVKMVTKQLSWLVLNMDLVHQEIGLPKVHIFKVLKQLLLNHSKEFTEAIWPDWESSPWSSFQDRAQILWVFFH
jgi:hypothetical protein